MKRPVYTYEFLEEDNCIVVYRNPEDDAVIHMPSDDPKEEIPKWIKVGVWNKKKDFNDYNICA